MPLDCLTEESVRFVDPPAAIKRLRELARSAGVVEANDTIPASEITPELDSNPGALYLKGIRYRDDVTQEQLSRLAGIPRRHLSEMENGPSVRNRLRNWLPHLTAITGAIPLKEWNQHRRLCAVGLVTPGRDPGAAFACTKNELHEKRNT